MNFLAHFALAGQNHGLILGAFLEDFINGGIENEHNKHLPHDVKEGLKLHRLIDTVTDTHDEVKACKALFYDRFGKYSPVIMDILFDHFLQKNWSNYYEEPLGDFRNRIYHSLTHYYLDIQPEKLKSAVQSMIRHDWLIKYDEVAGLQQALRSLHKRVQHLDLTQALPVMYENYDFINERFLRFYPYLKSICDKEFHLNGQ